MARYFTTLVLLSLLYSPICAQISGKVMDESNNPLPGALVCGLTKLCVRTSESGDFVIPKEYEALMLLRARCDGYRPSSAEVPGSQYLEFRLRRTSESTIWEIPSESRGPQLTSGQWVGERWRLFVPDNAEAHQDAGFAESRNVGQKQIPVIGNGSSDTFRCLTIRYADGGLLEWCHGPTWTLGLIYDWHLRESTQIQERDLKYEGSPLQEESRSGPFTGFWRISGTDARGTYKDGTRWRHVAEFGQSISYGRVSAQAAGFFDSMINTLCVENRK